MKTKCNDFLQRGLTALDFVFHFNINPTIKMTIIIPANRLRQLKKRHTFADIPVLRHPRPSRYRPFIVMNRPSSIIFQLKSTKAVSSNASYQHTKHSSIGGKSLIDALTTDSEKRAKHDIAAILCPMASENTKRSNIKPGNAKRMP